MNPPDAAQVLIRMMRVLEHAPIVPRSGLLYRLCEAGRSRLLPITVDRILALLPASHALAAPWRPYASAVDLFARADATDEDLYKAESSLATLADVAWSTCFDGLVECIVERSGSIPHSRSPLTHTTFPLGGTHEIPELSTTLHFDTKHGSTAVLIDLSPTMMGPESLKLWRFLLRRQDRELPRIIITRAAHPATYALMKGLGCKILAFYQYCAPDERYQEVLDAATNLRWIPVKPVSQFRRHAVMAHVRRNLVYDADVPAPKYMDRALSIARELGLGEPASEAERLHRLLCWHERAEIRLPPVWKAGILTMLDWSRVTPDDADRLIRDPAETSRTSRAPGATSVDVGTDDRHRAPRSGTTVTRIGVRIR